MQWQTSKDNVLRGYDFAYDGLNRLEESTYVEGAGMSQNKNRYSENILSYSPNGSIERLQRYGKKNNGTFGLIDDLTYSYNGNQIKAISDKAGSLLYNGSFDFKDGANADTEYFYDVNGALVKDLNKGISNIEYDVLGNLKCITFSNDFKTKYVYDAAGNKLRTTHESVVTNTTEGNCNTSTTTLLKKAGVSDGEINRIKNQIPKFKTGFRDVKPLSDEERKEALRQT